MPWSDRQYAIETDPTECCSIQPGQFEDASRPATTPEQQLYPFATYGSIAPSIPSASPSIASDPAIFAGLTNDVGGEEEIPLCTPYFEWDQLQTTEGGSHIYNAQALEDGEALVGHIKDPGTDSYRPPVPCNYCRTRRLQCLVIRTTTANPNPRTACSSCVALFRDCSLAEKPKRHPSQYETVFPVIGNLHGINEMAAMTSGYDTIQELSVLANHSQDVYSTSGSVSRERSLAHSKRASSRMTGRTKPLRQWFFRHIDNPFPSEEEKLELQQETGMTRTQVQDWFTNARRRQKASRQAQRRQFYPLGSPMPQSAFSDMTPFQRWRNSPPEDDHVPPEVVRLASNSQLGNGLPSLEHSGHHLAGLPDHYGGFSDHSSGPNSVSSDSVSSFESFASLNSYASSHCSSWGLEPGTSSIGKSIMATTTLKYQCTFCDLSFKKKSDWSRHETSVHIQLSLWICQQPEPVIWQVGQQRPQCNYCGIIYGSICRSFTAAALGPAKICRLEGVAVQQLQADAGSVTPSSPRGVSARITYLVTSEKAGR
ncbi:hypothetical protein HRR83_007948 [Exophiala dermatitidis]|uniref:Homeobox and C2H2 transcription factor n=1 Tax=Exophiala dermatitidis TaxID=5970 RepID=A0AAN6ITD0_EXODE|nr:hypothetical protein HRR74_007398 [Exophiala dermatitidis]KAJ4510059.1 hypothetical protein HRR73_006856 [Exophiala dermatitidis]KAJ4539061.1 hypothetical protein HRR77_006477 [Exophiala dermatitidis]KAJ4540658.1 hypothetical protein HRR76_004046 [Exophiala dermatitidis]KAJ4564506.1 hypothetical protein HRR79_005769 [Exophiala dermatitidis]